MRLTEREKGLLQTASVIQPMVMQSPVSALHASPGGHSMGAFTQ